MSIHKLGTLIDDIRKDITDGKYLEIMNTLKDVYEESKQQEQGGDMNLQEEDDDDDDEEDSEYDIILTEDNRRIINETLYYIKHVNIMDEDMVFNYPSGDPIGVLKEGIVIPFDDEE
jgi:hypothetical protein